VRSLASVRLYVLKLLRHHGMNDDSPRHVYKAVVLSKLLYASSAWWGFTCAADRQRLEASILFGPAFMHPTSPRCLNSLKTATTNCLTISGTTVQPSPRSTSTLARQNDYPYDLRPRRHSFSLTSKTDRRNFVNRLLLKDIILLAYHFIIVSVVYACVLSTVILKRE